MTDRPIIFSAPMVRALLDGRKTQTRVILKPQPGGIEQRPLGFVGSPARFVFTEVHPGGANWTHYAKIPYAPGDRLWVRENCATWGDHEAIYRADDAVEYGLAVSDGKFGAKWKARPSIHMPRWASRLTLTVTGVRVQRLQDISEADAVAEGIQRLIGSKGPNYFTREISGKWSGSFNAPTAAEVYSDLWNSLHGPGAWGANPWVVALTFDVVRGNIDQMPGVAG